MPLSLKPRQSRQPRDCRCIVWFQRTHVKCGTGCRLPGRTPGIRHPSHRLGLPGILNLLTRNHFYSEP